jgi:TonB family protein
MSQLLVVALVSFGVTGSGVAHASGQKVNKKKLQRAVMHFSQARALEGQGQFEEAVAEYRAALKEDPDEPYWYQALGAALAKRGNSQEALEAYSRARELSPDDLGLTPRVQEFHKGLAAGTSCQQVEKSLDMVPQFRRGTNVSPPRALSQPDPSYSDKARLIKYSGVVVLVIDIDTRGEVAAVQDVKPIGLGLDEKAIETVRRWRFQPALRDGTPVAAKVGVEVSFRIM